MRSGVNLEYKLPPQDEDEKISALIELAALRGFEYYLFGEREINQAVKSAGFIRDPKNKDENGEDHYAALSEARESFDADGEFTEGAYKLNNSNRFGAASLKEHCGLDKECSTRERMVLSAAIFTAAADVMRSELKLYLDAGDVEDEVVMRKIIDRVQNLNRFAGPVVSKVEGDIGLRSNASFEVCNELLALIAERKAELSYHLGEQAHIDDIYNAMLTVKDRFLNEGQRASLIEIFESSKTVGELFDNLVSELARMQDQYLQSSTIFKKRTLDGFIEHINDGKPDMNYQRVLAALIKYTYGEHSALDGGYVENCLKDDMTASKAVAVKVASYVNTFEIEDSYSRFKMVNRPLVLKHLNEVVLTSNEAEESIKQKAMDAVGLFSAIKDRVVNKVGKDERKKPSKESSSLRVNKKGD